MLIDSSIQFTTEQASGLVRAVRLVYRSTPGWTILSAALLAAQGILPLLSLYLMKVVVDAVARGLATPNPGAAFGQIALFVVLAGVTVLVGEVCRTIAGLASEAQSLTVTDYMLDIRLYQGL
jgi:ATP-binding cassette, subfamily B, bacterial